MRRALAVLPSLFALACGETPPEPSGAATAPTAGGSRPARCADPGAEASEEALRARLERLPECAPLRFALARRLVGSHRCDAAETELERLARAPETAEAGRVAQVRLASGPCGDRRRRARMAPLCESLLDGDPSADAWVACGRLKEALGETAQAMQHYARARERAPTSIEALAAPAALALRFRDFPVAARLYQALVATVPRRATAWQGLAKARRGSGDLAGAIAAMERAIALDAGAAEPRYHLALWLRESGALEPAVEQLRTFLVVAGEEPALEPARIEARATLERWQRGR